MRNVRNFRHKHAVQHKFSEKVENFGKKWWRHHIFRKTVKISGLYGRTDFYGNVYNFLGFHRRNLVEPGNESPFYVLSHKIKLNLKYSVLMTSFTWKWQVVVQESRKSRKWRHVTSWRQIFFKSSENVPFTNILNLSKLQLHTIIQKGNMIDFVFLRNTHKYGKNRHLSFSTPL